MVNKRCSLGRPTYTVFQKLFVITSRKLLNETGYTQPAYDVIKFQHHKSVLYTTFTTTTLKLKCTSRYTLKSYFQQLLYHQKFSDNANNKMRKYRLQQLFEMLFLSLDTGPESFSPCQRRSVQSQSPVAASVQPRCVFNSRIHAPAWCCCCHGNRAGFT